MSEPDKGMYDAINKGHARTTGEIMGWISATDMLQIGGLTVVGSVFRDLPEVEWITGRPTAYTDEGMTFRSCLFHSGRAIASSPVRTKSFSRSPRSGAEVCGKRPGTVGFVHRGGADFELWVRFFRHAKLYPVDALIGGFRCHPDSIGLQGMGDCERLHAEFVEAELSRMAVPVWLKLLRLVNRAVAPIPRIRVWCRNLTRYGLYHLPGPDWPPVIEYQEDGWHMRER